MKSSKVLIITVLSATLILVMYLAYANELNRSPKVETSLSGSENLWINKATISGEVEFVVKDANGNIKQKIIEHNLIVNAGLSFSASNVFANTAPTTTMQFIALGVGTGQPAAADTTLEREILIVSTGSSHTTHPHYMRGIATITQGVSIGGDTIGTAQLQKSFTVLNHSRSDNNQAEGELILADGVGKTPKVTEAGIFNSATGGNMFAKISIGGGGVTVQDGDVLQVTWRIDYD